MAIVQVQKSASFGVGTGTLSGNSTAGNLLIACISQTNLPLSPPSGWQLAVQVNSLGSSIYYYEGTVGGQTNFNFGANAALVFILEYSGAATSGSLDTVGSAGTALTTPTTVTTSGNVSLANSLGIGSLTELESKAGTTTLGLGAGWTNEFDNSATSTARHHAVSSLLNPTTGTTLSESVSSSTMNLNNMFLTLAVFKPAGAVVAIPNKIAQVGNQAMKRGSYY